MTDSEKLVQVFKQLNIMATTVTKNVVMVDNLRKINISLIKRIEGLEKSRSDENKPVLVSNEESHGIKIDPRDIMLVNGSGNGIKPGSK